jgi:hypothetical protein
LPRNAKIGWIWKCKSGSPTWHGQLANASASKTEDPSSSPVRALRFDAFIHSNVCTYFNLNIICMHNVFEWNKKAFKILFKVTSGCTYVHTYMYMNIFTGSITYFTFVFFEKLPTTDCSCPFPPVTPTPYTCVNTWRKVQFYICMH